MDDPISVIGSQTGVRFPPTIERLIEQGVDFLTEAFRATGVLSQSNRVTTITATKEFFGGGMGRKLLLTVAYETEAPTLQNQLFIKFPRDFGDPLRDLFAPLMEPEVRFSLLSRRKDFPITVPRCYFADYDPATFSGILITERISYGVGGIEPIYDKCLDYEIPDLLSHYHALVNTMGRLAGFHKAGKFGADTEMQFPFDGEAVAKAPLIPYTTLQLQEKLEKLASFAAAFPQFFPGRVCSSAFLADFIPDTLLVLRHEPAIMRYLNSKSDYIALCHWNVNVDNAWFWRNEQGELEAGLLDWGSVGQMNIAQAFFGLTCAAETDFLNANKAELMQLFLKQYRASGGPEIEVGEFAFFYKLAVAILGIAWILDAPSIIEAEIPDLAMVKDRFDPKLKNVFLARAQLQLLVVFLNEWQTENIGVAIKEFIFKTTLPAS